MASNVLDSKALDEKAHYVLGFDDFQTLRMQVARAADALSTLLGDGGIACYIAPDALLDVMERFGGICHAHRFLLAALPAPAVPVATEPVALLVADNGVPRRIRMDLWTPAELAIQKAVDVVEDAGAHVRLTDAVILLGKAREAVADFVDESLRAALPAPRPREEGTNG